MTRSAPQSATPAAPSRIGPLAQVLTCLAFCMLAATIIYFGQADPRAVFTRPLAPIRQLLVGQGLALVAAAVSWLVFRFTATSASTARTIRSYARLDLRGLNPLWIALAAAVGEEMLFRAALQPLLGIWIASVVFLLTHMPVYRFRRFDRATLAQMATVFGGSLVLGLVFDYAGLIAAMLVHLWIDIVGLLIVRASIGAKQGVNG